MSHAQEVLNLRVKFRKWLSAAGAEVLEPTNEYEMIRFRGNNGIGIIYRTSRERATFTGEAKEAWNCFLSAKSWRANPPAPRSNKRASVTIRALIARDGDLCFFCLEKVAMTDASVDHLVPVTSGGPSHIGNYALAHKKCNLDAGNLSLVEKIAERDKIICDKAAKQAVADHEMAANLDYM